MEERNPPIVFHITNNNKQVWQIFLFLHNIVMLWFSRCSQREETSQHSMLRKKGWMWGRLSHHWFCDEEHQHRLFNHVLWTESSAGWQQEKEKTRHQGVCVSVSSYICKSVTELSVLTVVTFLTCFIGILNNFVFLYRLCFSHPCFSLSSYFPPYHLESHPSVLLNCPRNGKLEYSFHLFSFLFFRRIVNSLSIFFHLSCIFPFSAWRLQTHRYSYSMFYSQHSIPPCPEY